MQLHRQKKWTFLAIFMMITTLLSSCGTSLQPPTASASTASATSELKLGVYKSGNGLVNAYGEKLYVQYTPELARRYKELPRPVPLSASSMIRLRNKTTHLISLIKQSTSSTGSCGQEGAPSNNAYNIRDSIDKLPTVSEVMHVSDPFLLLASEVSHQEETGMPVTSDELVNNCTEDFNPATGGMAYNLVYLNHGNNWNAILQVYKRYYPNDYPAIWDALNTFKDRATQYAKDNNLPIEEGQSTPTPTEVQPTPTEEPSTPIEAQPTPAQRPASGTVGQIVEAPASILDEPDWDKHHVLMPEQEWKETSFPGTKGISNSSKWLKFIQTAIDMGGMIPVLAPLNGVNSVIYFMRGDKLNGFLSAAAMIPFVSEEIEGVKLTERGFECVEGIAKATKLEKVGAVVGAAIAEDTTIAVELTQDGEKLENTLWKGTQVVNGETIITDIGAFGEQVAEDMLAENGWTNFTYIKNGSDNGIDLVAQASDGHWGFFEVKTSGTGSLPDLSPRQANMDDFVNDILYNAKEGLGRYQNIDSATKDTTTYLYNEYKNNPYNFSGNVIGVDLNSGLIRASRWNR